MGSVLIIAGPSGTGKSYIEKALKKKGYKKVTTMTSREPRAGEVDGIDYHFKSPTYFESMIAQGEMIESALVMGNYYGVSKEMFAENVKKADGSPVYVIVDPLGVKAYQDALDESYRVKTLFIDCPLELRKQRIEARIKPESTEKEIYQTAERLYITEHFEDQWKSMTTHDVYLPVSQNSNDVDRAVLLVERAFKSKFSIPTKRTQEPIGVEAPVEAAQDIVARLKKEKSPELLREVMKTSLNS